MRDRSHDKSQEGFLDTRVDQLGSPAHLLVITHPCSHSLRKPPSVITSQQSGGYVQSACVIEFLLFVDWKRVGKSGPGGESRWGKELGGLE